MEKSLEAGSYRIRGDWGGDERHKPSESSSKQLIVHKAKSTLVLDAPSRVKVNSSVTVTGLLTPARPNVKLLLMVQSQSGLVKKEMSTDSEGRYTATFLTEAAGTSSMTVRWDGTKDFEGAEAKATIEVMAPSSTQQDGKEKPPQSNESGQQTMILAASLVTVILVAVLAALRWRSAKA